MNSIKEIWESLTERFKNPIVYAFAVSWSVINYKIVLAIFSGESLAAKVNFIESLTHPNGSHDIWNLAVFPAATAVFYVFLFPAFSLLTTWSNAVYDRWNSNIRVKQARLGILTESQRARFEKQVSDLDDKLKFEAKRATEAQQATERKMSEMVQKYSQSILKGQFQMLQEYASNWTEETVRPINGRTVKGGQPYQAFVEKYGIPVSWTLVFKDLIQKGSISSTELADSLSITEGEAHNILVSLASLTMLEFSWVNGDLRFKLIESSWVAYLNGRPA
jgi:hypothetical protein